MKKWKGSKYLRWEQDIVQLPGISLKDSDTVIENEDIKGTLYNLSDRDV